MTGCPGQKAGWGGVRGEEGSIVKDYEEAFQGDETAPYFDGDDGYTFVYNYQNSSNYTLKMAVSFYVNNILKKFNSKFNVFM